MTNKQNTTNVANAGYIFAGHKATAIAHIQNAIRVEKQDYKQVRKDFVAGHVAKELYPDLTQAQAIAKAKGVCGNCAPDREAKAGQAKRTQVEHDAVRAADQAWSRIGRDAGVIKPKAGGTKKRKGGKAKQAKGGKPATKAPATPKNAAAANLALMNMAQSASAYCAKHKGVVSDAASHAAADFLAAMAKLAK